MRTDDGEAICSYMEDFQKNAAKALVSNSIPVSESRVKIQFPCHKLSISPSSPQERALSNPPMSKIPESGLMTLRRKFSAGKKSEGEK